MALPQASLGQMPSIGLGGYIPAPRDNPKIWEQAVAAFLQGAASGAAQGVTQRVLPDPQIAANQKFRSERAAADDALAQRRLDLEGTRIGNEKAYHDKALGQGDARITQEDRRMAQEKKLADDRLAAEIERYRKQFDQNELQLQVDTAMKGKQLGMQEPLINAQTRLADANARTTEQYTPEGRAAAQKAAAAAQLGNMPGKAKPGLVSQVREYMMGPDATVDPTQKASTDSPYGTFLQDYIKPEAPAPSGTPAAQVRSEIPGEPAVAPVNGPVLTPEELMLRQIREQFLTPQY